MIAWSTQLNVIDYSI